MADLSEDTSHFESEPVSGSVGSEPAAGSVESELLPGSVESEPQSSAEADIHGEQAQSEPPTQDVASEFDYVAPLPTSDYSQPSSDFVSPTDGSIVENQSSNAPSLNSDQISKQIESGMAETAELPASYEPAAVNPISIEPQTSNDVVEEVSLSERSDAPEPSEVVVHTGVEQKTSEESKTRPLKIAVVSSGSRGDVQPYIACCMGLKARGHDVVMVTEERMRGLVEEYGITFRKIAGDPTGLLFEKHAQEMLAKNEIMKVLKETERFNAPSWNAMLADLEKACEGVDVIVTGGLNLTTTLCLAEKNQCGWLPLILGPSMPTNEFAPWIFSNGSLPFLWLNSMSWSALFGLMWTAEKAKINAWRTQVLKLPAFERGVLASILARKSIIAIACPTLYIPNSRRPADWPEEAKITNFIYVAPTTESAVPAALRQFVEGGSKPLYIGFGSMPAPDPLVLIRMAIDVVQRTKMRAVLCAGWTEINFESQSANGVVLPPELLLVKSAPHDWLFPRCAAILHHCGVGTTAAALRSGVPQIPCPFMLDQFFNANRLHDLGVAPVQLPFHKMTTDLLVANVIQTTTGPSSEAFASKARAIAATIASTDGISMVCDLVEQAVNRPTLGPPAWELDAKVPGCPQCKSEFGIFKRRHHCRQCSKVLCADCISHEKFLPWDQLVLQKVCANCFKVEPQRS